MFRFTKQNKILDLFLVYSCTGNIRKFLFFIMYWCNKAIAVTHFVGLT